MEASEIADTLQSANALVNSLSSTSHHHPSCFSVEQEVFISLLTRDSLVIGNNSFDNLVSRQKKPELSSPFSLTYLLSGLIRCSNHDCVTNSQSYEEVEHVAQFWTQMG